MNILNKAGETLGPVMIESMKKHSVPGAAMHIIDRDADALTLTLGTADMTTGRAVDRSTHFEAASLTKPLFGYIVLDLAEKGIIDLDKPICEVIEGNAPTADERIKLLTPRMVLCHASGLPNWDKKPHGMSFDPGTGFGYSGEAYAYLQCMVEYVTGERFDILAQRTVFAPLGMDNSALIWTGPLSRTLARTVDKNGEVEPPRHTARHSTTCEPCAAYSLYVTIEEYPRFLHAVMNAGIAPRIRETRNHAADGIDWGLGWGLYGDLIWHWGDNGGFKSLTAWDAETKCAFLMHTNGENGLLVCYDAIRCATGLDTDAIEAFINAAE